MEIYQNFHISVNILQYRSIYAYIFRSYMFSYIGRYKTITYIGQYKPTSLKSFQYYIYRSIYADKRHISIHICNISWFKLGAYIDAIYVRSYNDRYIKTYILPIYRNIYSADIQNLLRSRISNRLLVSLAING